MSAAAGTNASGFGAEALSARAWTGTVESARTRWSRGSFGAILLAHRLPLRPACTPTVETRFLLTIAIAVTIEPRATLGRLLTFAFGSRTAYCTLLAVYIESRSLLAIEPQR